MKRNLNKNQEAAESGGLKSFIIGLIWILPVAWLLEVLIGSPFMSILLIASYLMFYTNTKKKRVIPESIQKVQTGLTKNICWTCGTSFVGYAIPYKEYFKEDQTYIDHKGVLCDSCGASSCPKCNRKAFDFHWWFGYEKARCRKCGEINKNPQMVVKIKK
jgi:hypothetical protein